MALSNLGPVLWNCADSMRGSMTADEYKDYLLGLVFLQGRHHLEIILSITREIFLG